jgi:cell division septum initiation protein DivIVA
MAMSVEEARNFSLPAKRGRYDQDLVDKYRRELIESYSATAEERDNLKLRVAGLEEELTSLRDLERELRESLFAAQRIAKEIRDHAETERQQIVGAAHAEAAKVREKFEVEQAHLRADVERLRELDGQLRLGYKQFLAAALELLETSKAAGETDSDTDAATAMARRAAEAAASARAG